jgi:hypothetical protein
VPTEAGKAEEGVPREFLVLAERNRKQCASLCRSGLIQDELTSSYSYISVMTACTSSRSGLSHPSFSRQTLALIKVPLIG